MKKRTIFTPNKIIDRGNYCEMILCGDYRKKYREIGRTFFSKKHLEKVKKHKWHISSYGYSNTWVYKNKKKTALRLHHLIFGKPKNGLLTDHINRNRLDNRDENLRFVTHSQSLRNRKCLTESGCPGVYFDKKSNKWRVIISLGTYKNKNQAIKIRKKAENIFSKKIKQSF